MGVEWFRVEATLGLARVLAPGGSVEPAVVYKGRVYPLGAWGYKDVREVMLEHPPETFETFALKVSSRDHGLPLTGMRLAAPLERPGKLILVGLNYYDHAREVNMVPPKLPELFMKSSNALIGPGDPIILHDPELKVDLEVELAMVIGTPARNLGLGEAMEAVWGYTCLNDVTSRAEALLMGFTQWWRGKSRDTYSPIGPVIVPRTRLDPGRGLRLTASVSGERLQDGNTKDMIHNVAVIVYHATMGRLLEPGDVISTGTPAGIGHARSPPRYLKPGDVVEACVEGVGCIANPVIPDII